MSILVALVVALVIGLIAYFIATIVPFTRQYADVIGLIVALLVFVVRMGWL